MVIPFFDGYPYKIIQNIFTHYEQYHVEAYESGWWFQHLRKIWVRQLGWLVHSQWKGNKIPWFQSPPTRNSTSIILKAPFPSLKTPTIPPSLPRPGGTSRDDGTGPCSTSRAQRDRGERLHSDGSCLRPWKFTSTMATLQGGAPPVINCWNKPMNTSSIYHQQKP